MVAQLPRISVVVIFRDAERFFEDAIGSVFAQTYPDWELLLVDDGSVDHSSASARCLATRFPERVRYLRHPGGVNRGMSASRNLGIRHARGEYLAFLDADDVWFPNALAEQLEILKANPNAALVYGPIQWWYSWTGQPEDRERDYIEGLGVAPGLLVRAPRLLTLFLCNRAAVPSGVLVRREIVRLVGGFEDAFRGEYEDQVFCAKVCLNHPVFASGKCWYRYRQHPDSCVSTGHRTGQTRRARLAFLDWLVAYLLRQRCLHPGVWWAVEYERWRWGHPAQYRLWRRGQARLNWIVGGVRATARTRAAAEATHDE